MEKAKTAQGYGMNLKLRARIVMVMAENAGLPLKDVAAQLGIHKRTLHDYLTREVRAEIEAKRRDGGATLDDVDKAMMAQACAGNVAAARLVYMRMAQRGEAGALPSLEEMEVELQRLKTLERTGKETTNGENTDAAAAMAADAAG